MTIEIINFNNQGIEIFLSDIITGSDIINLQRERPPANLLTEFQYVLIDYSHVTKSQISLDEVKLIAKNDKGFMRENPGLHVAAIVPNRIFRSVAKIWITLTGQHARIRCFSSRKEAKHWIKQFINP